ncbi:hypothetical protein Dimus_039593 [Dionaea muscipula]
MRVLLEHLALALPRSLFYSMVAPQDLDQLHSLSPEYLLFPIKNLHRLLLVGHVLTDVQWLKINDVARTMHILPQHRYMEDIVHLSQLRWKSNTVRNITNAIQHIEGTNVAGTELLLPAKTDHTLPWRYSQKHLIPNLELKVSSTVISIALLSALCCQKSVPDHSYLLTSILHQLRPQKLSLTDLIPTCRRSASPAIKCLIWSHPQAGLETIIVRKLNQRELVIPIPLPVQ